MGDETKVILRRFFSTRRRFAGENRKYLVFRRRFAVDIRNRFQLRQQLSANHRRCAVHCVLISVFAIVFDGDSPSQMDGETKAILRLFFSKRRWFAAENRKVFRKYFDFRRRFAINIRRRFELRWPWTVNRHRFTVHRALSSIFAVVFNGDSPSQKDGKTKAKLRLFFWNEGDSQHMHLL